jgi:hypothetical protein
MVARITNIDPNETPSKKALRLGVKVFEDKTVQRPVTPPNPVVGVCGRCNKEVLERHPPHDMCMSHDCPAGISCVLLC